LRSTRQRAASTSAVFLGRRLGERAGYTDNQRLEAIAPGSGRMAQRNERVGNDDDRDGGERIDGDTFVRIRLTLDDQRCGTRVRCVDDETVTVSAFTGEREERVALFDLARIDRAAADRPAAGA